MLHPFLLSLFGYSSGHQSIILALGEPFWGLGEWSLCTLQWLWGGYVKHGIDEVPLGSQTLP